MPSFKFVKRCRLHAVTTYGLNRVNQGIDIAIMPIPILGGPLGGGALPISMSKYHIKTTTSRNRSRRTLVSHDSLSIEFVVSMVGQWKLGVARSRAGVFPIHGDNNTTKTTKETEESQQQQQQPKAKQRLGYLTAYHSLVSLMTFVAILAMDFHVFPRRLCQDENSRLQIDGSGRHLVCHSVWDLHTHKAPGKEQLHKCLLHLLPLILIGVIQIITNKSLEYQEHVSEYGVHWNLFFTMGGLGHHSEMHRSLCPPSWILPTALWSRMNSTWSPWDFNVSSNGALDCVTNY
jgi:hypothetical protein